MSYTVEAIVGEDGKVHIELPDTFPGQRVKIVTFPLSPQHESESAADRLAGSIVGDFDLRGPILTEEEWGALY
ncbi:hypothetical protein EON79_16610 [bacterium]|nr:MAG: hypothetical protein EON79_16610 [bacterium]